LEANGIPVTALVNGESASGMGFDFATTAQLTDGLQTTLSFSWNDLRMDGPVFSGGVLLFDKGDRLNLSPEYTAGISMDYSFAFGASGFKGNLSIGANHVDEQITRTIYLGAQSVGVGDAMLIGQSSFSIASPDRWTATVFVDNVNNEQGVRYAQPYGLPEYSQRIRPRTLGLQLDYHF
jgi:iron complex outermembrane receptor protein